MTTETRERYNNGQLKKVDQIATVVVVVVTHRDHSWSDIKDSLSCGGRFYVHKCREWEIQTERTTIAEVSYRATGANRTDISRPIYSRLGDQVVHISKATVTYP